MGHRCSGAGVGEMSNVWLLLAIVALVFVVAWLLITAPDSPHDEGDEL
jgi:hypothetical protein